MVVVAVGEAVRASAEEAETVEVSVERAIGSAPY